MNKRMITVAVLCGSLAIPATAGAQEPDPANFKNAAKYCKALRAAAGESNFKAMFGGKSNAYGKCVSKAARRDAKQEDQAKSNASKECKAEEAADPAAFKTKYGTGKNGKNAHGKCVSQKAKQNKAAADKREAEDVNSAEECRAERKQDPEAFADKYGTNENDKNAFGKCVSKKSKEKAEGTEGGATS
jgi:hypothetical protein